MRDVYSRDGRARIHYDAVWSPSRPYAVFIDGTAMHAFATIQLALYYLNHDKRIITVS